jgi:hypothetical protein
MAILVVTELAGVTAEEDAALVKTMDLEGSPPAGARLRMAGPTPTGWRIVSLWDSEADYERFRAERVGPALSSAGRAMPTFEVWPIETVYTL